MGDFFDKCNTRQLRAFPSFYPRSSPHFASIGCPSTPFASGDDFMVERIWLVRVTAKAIANCFREQRGDRIYFCCQWQLGHNIYVNFAGVAFLPNGVLEDEFCHVKVWIDACRVGPGYNRAFCSHGLELQCSIPQGERVAIVSATHARMHGSERTGHIPALELRPTFMHVLHQQSICLITLCAASLNRCRKQRTPLHHNTLGSYPMLIEGIPVCCNLCSCVCSKNDCCCTLILCHDICKLINSKFNNAHRRYGCIFGVVRLGIDY